MKKGIGTILAANIINMLLGVITAFLLPKFLPVDEYASIKTYQLYVTYCGLFHLGYVDAIYLEYGGKKITDIGSKNIIGNILNMHVFQLIVSLCVVLLGVLQRDYMLVFFGITIMPMNFISYFQYLYQAIGAFEKYSVAVKMLAILNFICNVLLLFICNCKQAIYYVVLYSIIKIFISVYLEYSFLKNNNLRLENLFFSISETKMKIKKGFPLMIGNLISEIVTSIDRWFVKFFFLVNDFAQYSFAVNIQSIMNAIVTPITLTLYNYFCNNRDKEVIITIRNYLFIFGSFVISGAFFIKSIIISFLGNYSDSLDIIYILLLAQYFLTITKGIYVNLYKVYKRQKVYMQKLIFILLISIILNALFMIIFNNILSLALATLVSAVLWLVISDMDFDNIHIELKQYIYMIVVSCIYWVCLKQFNMFNGLVTYEIAIFLVNLCFYKKDVNKLMNMVWGRFINR